MKAKAESISRREPNLKRYSEEQVNAMLDKYTELILAGRTEEAQQMVNTEIPLHWKSAKILKEIVGIDCMIESGTNLSEAVEHFGKQWLES